MRRRSNREQVDPAVQAARITRRGTLITAMATVIAALIGGLFAAYKVGNDQGAAGVAPSTVTVVSTVPGSGSPSRPGGTAQASDTSAQVRLDSGTGVDIDAADPRSVETNGPNGDTDLYFGDSGLVVNRSAMFYYYGTESEAKVGCPKVVAGDKPAPGGPIVLSAGNQFCVRTSKGSLGWVGCNDVKYTSGGAGYIVLNYRLFTQA